MPGFRLVCLSLSHSGVRTTGSYRYGLGVTTDHLEKELAAAKMVTVHAAVASDISELKSVLSF